MNRRVFHSSRKIISTQNRDVFKAQIKYRKNRFVFNSPVKYDPVFGQNRLVFNLSVKYNAIFRLVFNLSVKYDAVSIPVIARRIPRMEQTKMGKLALRPQPTRAAG